MRWSFPQPEIPEELLEHCQGNSLLAQVLANRGVLTALEASYYYGSQEPELTPGKQLPDANRAADRIRQAVAAGELIAIYGDYDVDGTTATALLKTCLDRLGARSTYYTPNRFREGYGLNAAAVRHLAGQGVGLMVTCDCGSSNVEEVRLGSELGLDTIVTDHHSLPDPLPPALAVVNPKILPETHPLYWLPGVGVVYKLAEMLLGASSIADTLDLVALGMVADLAPLRGENRLLTKHGLKVLGRTTRPGLRALLRECGIEPNEEAVGFAIGPRINAAGRLDDAQVAVRMFLTDDPQEATDLASQLSHQNSTRQQLCDRIYEQAVAAVEEAPEMLDDRVLMLAGEDWHQGVIGIVASRLVERYRVPVFLGAREDDGSIKGSARGIEAIDLFREMSKHAALFDRYGGHKAAAGFSMSADNWRQFRSDMSQSLREVISGDDRVAKLTVDANLAPGDFTLDKLRPLLELAPFGLGFPKPVLATAEPVRISRAQPMGRDGKHSKIWCDTLEILAWRRQPHELPAAGTEIEIACVPQLNTFRGSQRLQLELRDHRAPRRWHDHRSFLREMWAICRQGLTATPEELAARLRADVDSCWQGLAVLHRSGAVKCRRLSGGYVEVSPMGEPQHVHLDTRKLQAALRRASENSPSGSWPTAPRGC